MSQRMIEDIPQRLQQIRHTITTTAGRVGRNPAAIRLIAVSKHQPIDRIAAAMAAGHTDFGENYAQELTAKVSALRNVPTTSDQRPAAAVVWHFIGHLQRNKVKDILPHVAWIHSIDSRELAHAIDKKTDRPIACCVEVNLAGEATKHGVAPDLLPGFLHALSACERLTIHGLMCIPPIAADPEASRPCFRQLAQLLATLNAQQCYRHPLTELSMGMTNDFTVAIEEGATMLRIGTAIFGERSLCEP